MSCNLYIDQTKLTNKLREKVGTNDTLYTSYISNILTTTGILETFEKYIKTKTDIDLANIPDDRLDEIVEYVQEFYNKTRGDIEATVEDRLKSDAVFRFGYTSTNARILSQRITANYMVRAFNQIRLDKNTTIEKILKEETKKRKRPVTKKEYFANIALASIKKEIINRLENKGIANKATVIELFKENNTLAIEKLFEKNNTIQDKNLLALYKEVLGNRTKFFDKIFKDSRLGKIRFEKENLEEDATYEAIDEQIEEDNNVDDPTIGNSSENDRGSKVDNSTEKFGNYANFMTHVNDGVKTYLGSLYKLHSGNKVDKKYDLDTDNELGIPDVMDANQCSAVLYNYGNYTNVDSMIASIKEIANTIPGFAAFHKMYDDFIADRNLAYEFYNTFGKTNISKIETILNGDEAVTRRRNYSSDKLLSLKFEYLNSIKASSIVIQDANSIDTYKNISSIIKDINDNIKDLSEITGNTEEDLQDIYDITKETDNLKLKLTSELYKNLHRFYPTINEYSISNYLTKANDGDIVTNANKLNIILKNTIDSGYESQNEYFSRQAEISKAYKELSQIEERRRNGERVSSDKIEETLTKLYAKDYISEGSRNAAFDLATLLVPYSLVKTELNSSNVHGNQSSNIINNSMITNIINTLKSTIALENFGKYKFKSRQYDFSNIMLEHKDKNGKIINYGLFYKDSETKQYVPTKYANYLIKNSLFDGASNLNTYENILYSEMSKGDYLATSFINFFSSNETYEDNPEDIPFANYFMRIPSDAPKNFSIKAPRYSVKGLVKKGSNGEVVIDVNHPVFNQFKQIFIQELTDAHTAISSIFQTKNGLIIRNSDDKSKDYGKPMFKDGFDESKNTERKLFKGYHIGKGNNIFEKIQNGNVFKSDRFTITTTDEKGKVVVKNYGQEILDEAFDIFYGGANNKYIHTEIIDNVNTVVLTDEQNSAVNKHISKFILDYVEQAKSRIQNYKNFIVENLYNNTNIAEFALNYHLMYVSFGDLFEGDTKFYKDTQTFLKRAKEVQASGIPYGLTDYDMDLRASRTRVMSKLNDKRFAITKEDGTKEVLDKYAYDKAIAAGHTIEEATDIANTIEQTNKFRAVTIKNTIRTGETIGVFKRDSDGEILKDENGTPQFEKMGVLTRKLIETLRNPNGANMTLANAKVKAAKMMAGYADTTVNDAQSYITFEEWVRRVSARGQLNKYMPLIEAVLDETKPVDTNTILEFIQVQKNFYYDQHYDSTLGVIAPRQIKNAEFVLVPRFIKGTQLEQVYNMMKECGIDQLNTEETSKAGKHNVLTIWDNEGNITQESIDDFKANAAQSTELYNYNYLYTQQETPQHINAENKAGIQIMKKIVDNITENSKLYPLKEKFFKLYSTKIKNSFDSLMKEFNLELDENGELKLEKDETGELVVKGLDVKLFYERLQEEVFRLGLDSNVCDYVTLSVDGEPIMPSYMTNIVNKLESISQSLFNSRITRQKLPGFHAAQITNVGFTFGDKVKNKKYSNKLRYHPDGEPYVEIMLPKSNFGLKYTKKDGTLKSDDQLLEELRNSGLDTMIGYRIPTEGKQSVCVMKVVGFTDDTLGSTIVVPDDWVAQTGSDFDIDSVYGINFKGNVNKETGIIEKIEYDEQNLSGDAINNEILDTMIKILSDPLSLEENLSRSNFDDIKAAKKEMTTDKETVVRKGRSAFNIFDQADYQEDVMSGAKLKAFSVTRDTFCSICNTVQPTISETSSVKMIYRAEDGFTLKDLKKSFNNVKQISDGVFLVTHNTFGWTKNNKNVEGLILTAYSSQTTAHILDAVKEGAVANVNEFTFKVYKLFPDLGSNYKTAVAFMMQPGVSAIVNAYNSNKSIYGEGGKNPIKAALKIVATKLLALDNIKITDKTSIEDIIKKLQKYNLDLLKMFDVVDEDFKVSLDDSQTSKLIIDKSKLKDRLFNTGIFETTSPVETKQQLLFDLGVILQYNKLSNLGTTISDYARVCNPDKFGAKQTIFETNKVFDDINKIIKKELIYPVLLKDNNAFLLSIYPGVLSGLNSFITSPAEKSSYQPLYNFLKYATATSIKVNRQLFITQSPIFVREVMELQNLFSDGRTINEKIYKDFQNYIINSVYQQADVVSKSCTYLLGEGVVYRDGSNKTEELSRIYGYGKSPAIKVPDGKGNLVYFDVEDINNPTQREINQFATLSPAQKVDWIQHKFVNSGVFKYLRTSTYNTSKTGKQGRQTIQYIEGNDNIEIVYDEFQKCYYNTNPFVKLATIDLIKYSFAVEGFKMRRNAVNKIIKNNVLYEDSNVGGTGLVSQINSAIRNIAEGVTDISELRDKYIRSHSNISQIIQNKVKLVEKSKEYKYLNEYGVEETRIGTVKDFELNRYKDEIIIANGSLAETYGLITDFESNTMYGINPYVKLTFGNNTILYKVEDLQYGDVIAYPVNTLEENEFSTWSVNPNNNKFLSEEYYKSIVEDYKELLYSNNETATLDDIIESRKENRDNYKPSSKRNIISNYAKSFNINDKNTPYTDGFERVINKVTSYFENEPFGRLYINSLALGNFIKHTGADNGSIQNINGKYYTIQKVDFSSRNKKYITDGNSVKESNPQIQEIMESAQKTGYAANSVFLITPFNEVRYSSVTENRQATKTDLGVKSMKAMTYRRASEGDVDAINALKYLNDKDITNSSASVTQNIDEVIRISSEYVQNATEKIMNDLNYFIKDSNGITYSIANPEVIALIRNDFSARQRFLKTILDARAFVKNYGIINELDITAESDESKYFLEKIKKSINTLQNANIIADAERLFVNNYLSKLSNNPLVQDDIISLLDGYHSAGVFDAWVNDLQETSSPLLQIITKEVMGDIRAKEMLAKKRVKEFKQKLNEIKSKAKEAGVEINWKHIIDDNGKFIQNYNQAFLDKLISLRDNISKAKTLYEEGSEEHLRAQLEYDKWKLKYTNQMLKDDYYRIRIELQERMLGDGTDENPGFKHIYVAYSKLAVKRRELLNHAKGDVLSKQYQDELREVKQEIDNLVEDYYYDQSTESFIPKMSSSDPNNPFSGESRKIMSLEAANALKSYLKAMKALREDYFTESEKFGFNEQLERNLDIIKTYEVRDANGEITTPMEELMKHEDYVKAKLWIDNNTRFVVEEGVQNLLDTAFKRLHEKSENRHLLRRIAKKNDAYDARGTINATLFSDSEIRDIKNDQLASYNIKENQPFSDKTLISNAPTDDTIFDISFYKGMTLNGAKNQDYLAKVSEINSILYKYYTSYDKTLHTELFSKEDIESLIDLYKELDNIKSKGNSTNGKSVHKFIEDNVEFTYNIEKYEEQRNYASQNENIPLELWDRLNTVVEEDGTVHPNRYLFGYAKPKGYKEDGTGNNTFVDLDKTTALRNIKKYTRNTKTQYYYQKYKEMSAKSKDEFRAWYEDNHIYNPYTHKIEPIKCWTKFEIKDDVVEGSGAFAIASGMYIPSFQQTDIAPKEEELNENYKVGKTTADNYKGNSSEYNNDIKLNSAEEEIRDLFQDTLRALANTTQAKKFLDKGYMVTRSKESEHNAKFYAKESLKLLGWINTNSGKESWYSDDRIDYANDTTPTMPMTSILKSKDSITVPRTPPERNENESLEDYEKRIDEFNKKKKEIEEHNAKIHKDLLDNNWEEVMEEFINKAAHFNAVQENKYMLFFAKQMIDKLNIYNKNLGFNDLQTTGEKLEDGEVNYVTTKDTRLQEQFNNWIRRLVYDQWKKPNNKFTRGANILQSLTSAKFMMFNFTGGIANITMGGVQILGENLAKEYFGHKHWALGMNDWRTGLPSFIADMYKDKATSLESAIVKFMNVVDFDENTGSVHVPDASTYIKRARDLAFSPQAIGEHMMQNGAMFAMMHSHRLFINHDKENNGRLSYELLTESQYMNKVHQQALKEILTDEQKELFNKFIKSETENANSTKEYAWFRKDFATEFANIYLNNEQKKEFIDKRDKIKGKKKKEFIKHPTLISQLALGSDGQLDFKKDSILSSLGDEAYDILGRFKDEVISVNKKIHGVYDKLGAARLESYWFGGLVMQYHKHLYPGIMKRYRRQGYFNEERGTIEKGCYASIKDFLSLPLHKAKAMKKIQAENGMTDAEVSTMQGLQNIVKSYVDFALHAKLNYETMSEYDRANIRRAMGDLLGILSAVCFAIGLKVISGGDDDKEKGLIYNLMMYEADRLASESNSFNPFGVISEGKKLWSSPVAFANSITDGLHTVGLITQWAIQGDDFDPYYSSGAYAGENKLEVKIKRNIPVYHSIYMLQRLERNNKYYKLGDNMISVIPTNDIAEYILD